MIFLQGLTRCFFDKFIRETEARHRLKSGTQRYASLFRPFENGEHLTCDDKKIVP